MADGGAGAMTRMNDGRFRQLHELLFERADDVVVGAAPEIGAANASGKEGIAGKELRLAEREVTAIVWKIKRDAARGVAGRVNDAGKEVAPLEDVTLLEELMNVDQFGGGHAKKGGLHFHAAIKRKVVAVHHHRRASVLVELGEAADVVDVGMGADDGFDLELVAAEQAEDTLDLVARIDDDRLMSTRVADDRTVALEHANRELEIDHLRVGGVGQIVRWVKVIHGESIPSGICSISSGVGAHEEQKR